ncbi:hypothetical protein IEQ34_021832 [Dendrobium chrysotoxum]|uniref:Phosphoadenosine phosphosulphate reductase domain-containing protein n=1 Tax=Dendrobium chrysotoxum TaxID=161865 RepID=A0AAV7FVV5_DENCH|nr:hypothetical protein IEQ34_021832 [Dendrobium chrysotoxum]
MLDNENFVITDSTRKASGSSSATKPGIAYTRGDTLSTYYRTLHQPTTGRALTTMILFGVALISPASEQVGARHSKETMDKVFSMDDLLDPLYVPSPMIADVERCAMNRCPSKWLEKHLEEMTTKEAYSTLATSYSSASVGEVSYEQLTKEMEHASLLAIIDRALEMFGNDILLSFIRAEDVALIEYAHLTGRPFGVFSLDTGRLNPEFYRFFDVVEKHYDIHIEYMFPNSVEVQALVKSKGLFSFYENGHQECCRACWKLNALTQDQCFHGFIVKSGCTTDISVQNSLVSFYGKSNNVESVHELFDEISVRDVICWSLLISSYVQAGYAVNAMQLFRNMSMENGIEIDGLAFVSVLQACSFVGYINYGRSMRTCVLKRI